ncbi:MAG: shikimate kinase [bacterium]
MGTKSNLSLVGFMGSGKSTVGQEVARLLRFDFLDSDQLVQREMGLTVSEIFEWHGEEEFRKVEKKQIETMVTASKTVWATGGGAWMDEKVRKILAENSWVFWLRVSAEQSWKRVSANLSQRPLLARSGDPFLEIERKLKERETLYALADYEISTDNRGPKEVADEIARMIQADHPRILA